MRSFSQRAGAIQNCSSCRPPATAEAVEKLRLPVDDRAALFGETGAVRGVANTIIENDFWVSDNVMECQVTLAALSAEVMAATTPNAVAAIVWPTTSA
jgi:hypothetical protein